MVDLVWVAERVLNPDVGLYVDSMVVFRIAVHRDQRLWHDHVAGTVEG